MEESWVKVEGEINDGRGAKKRKRDDDDADDNDRSDGLSSSAFQSSLAISATDPFPPADHTNAKIKRENEGTAVKQEIPSAPPAAPEHSQEATTVQQPAAAHEHGTPEELASSDRGGKGKSKRRKHRDRLRDLLDGGYWRPRPAPTFDTAEGGEPELQERAEAEAEGNDRDEPTIVSEQKRQRREEKGKERVKESQDSRDVTTEVNAALPATVGASTGPEAELSEIDSLDDTSDSDTDRGRSQSTHATTSGEKVAVKDIDGGLDGDYWKTVSKRRKAKGDFHDWSVFAPDNEESERDTEFVPGMPVYTREDMEISEGSSDWSDPDDYITVRSDAAMLPGGEADAEGEEESFDEAEDDGDADGESRGEGGGQAQFSARKAATDKRKAVKLKIRTIGGVRGIDFFCRSSIQVWSADKVRAWVQRYQNPNGYYYRLTDPGLVQRQGAFTIEEKQAFLRRYEEFGSNDWRVGANWGVFALAAGLENRVGYQCSSHYRRLLEEGELDDPSYEKDPITGKVKQTYTIIGGRDIDQGLNALREVWNTPELQRLEEKVDALVCHYHPTLYAKYQNSAYSKRWNAVLIRRGDRRRRRHKQRRRIPHDDADGTNSQLELHGEASAGEWNGVIRPSRAEQVNRPPPSSILNHVAVLGRDRSREGMLRSEEDDDVNEELFDHGLFGWPAPQSSRTVRVRLQNTASRSSQRRKVADQKRAQRKEVTRRRLSGGNAAASQTLSSTPRPNDTHQSGPEYILDLTEGTTKYIPATSLRPPPERPFRVQPAAAEPAPAHGESGELEGFDADTNRLLQDLRTAQQSGRPVFFTPSAPRFPRSVSLHASLLLAGATTQRLEPLGRADWTWPEGTATLTLLGITVNKDQDDLLPTLCASLRKYFFRFMSEERKTRNAEPSAQMLQDYDDIDLCLCFVRDCIKRHKGVKAQHFAAVLRGEVSELVQSLGALDPNAYSYTRGLIHTFRLAVLIHAHILEWLFMLAQAPEPETTHHSFSLLDDHVDDLSAPPEEAVLVAAAETALEEPRDSSDASQMFIAHVNMLLAQLFALFQDFPNFIKLPPVLTNATQRPVMLLWRKIMHFTDAHHALRPSNNVIGGRAAQPFWKTFNAALMELKALPTLSAKPPTNHDPAPHVWEFKWDLLFHLIPLLQFDATTGTLLGVQHVAQHANWQLVLDLLKKAPTNIYSASPGGLEHIQCRHAVLVRILELSQVWPPSTEIIPQLWAIVRESYKTATATASSSSPASKLTATWPDFVTNFGPTTLPATLTLNAPSAWNRDKDYDLFLRILLVHIYKTGLPAALPPSPLLPPLPAPSTSSQSQGGSQSPLRAQQPFASPLAASATTSAMSPQQRSVFAAPGVRQDCPLLPVGRSAAAALLLTTTTLSAVPAEGLESTTSFSCYPFVRPTALGLPQAAMKKFTSVIYQSAWIRKLLPATDLLCLDLLLNIDKDKRSYVTLLKDKINELVGHSHFLKAEALLQLALFGQAFGLDFSGVATDLHECMKLMWTEYITALKQVEPASPQQGRRAWRPTPDEQKRREETRVNAQRACEEMEPHWKLALRQLTRVFTNARGNFDCFEYRLIPDKWDSWLCSMFFEIKHLPHWLAMAAINLVDQTLPKWSAQRSGSGSSSASGSSSSSSSFECSFTLQSHYRTMRAPVSGGSPSSTFGRAGSSTFSSPPLQRPPSSSSPSSSSPYYAPSFASRVASQPPPPPPLALEAVTAADAAAPPGVEVATDDWDEVMAAIDVDAMMRQAEAAKEQEAEARRRLDEARRREDEERHARQARERQLAQEKANMELLARCLNQVVEKVRRAILYDRNTPTIRTSLVNLLAKLSPLSIGHKLLTWERAFELFGLNVAEPLNGAAAQPRQGDNYPTIGMPERRRLGIQFLAQVFDDLPLLPPYYLQPYVAPLFQQHGAQMVRIWLGGMMANEWTKQHTLTAALVRCSHQLPFFQDLGFKEEYRVSKDQCFGDRHTLVTRVLKKVGELWTEWNEDEEIAGVPHKRQQLRRDFEDTIVGGFLGHVDRFIAAMNEDLGRTEGVPNKHAHYSLRARQVFKMVGGLLRYGGALTYQSEHQLQLLKQRGSGSGGQQRQQGQLVLAVCDKYFQTREGLPMPNLRNSTRDILRLCKYEMLTNVLQFLKTSFDASPACDEDLRRLLFDVLDESMRTGFAQALDPTPQHDKTRFEDSLRSRIVEVLVRDSPTLRRHIETTFISPALQTDRVAVDISKSSSLTGFVSGYRKAAIALVEAIFRHAALTHDAFVEDALILAVPLLRCLDAPSFDPTYPFLDGPAASVRLSCYDVVQLIARKVNTAPRPPPVQSTSTSSASSSSVVSLDAVAAGGRDVPAFLAGFLRCALLHVILDLNSAEAASRLQRAPPELTFVKRAFNEEVKRVEGLVHTQSPASQREPLPARSEPSFLVTTRASFDLSVASDRDKMLALLVGRAVDAAVAVLAVPEPELDLDQCHSALQQVLDRMGRPEGLAGLMAKRREPVVKSLLTHIPILMHHLQQRRQQRLLSGREEEEDRSSAAGGLLK